MLKNCKLDKSILNYSFTTDVGLWPEYICIEWSLKTYTNIYAYQNSNYIIVKINREKNTVRNGTHEMCEMVLWATSQL
jgi:hypothetical protein